MAKKALNDEKEVKNKKSSKKTVDDKKTVKKETNDTSKKVAKKVKNVEIVNDFKIEKEKIVATEIIADADNSSSSKEPKKKNIFSIILTVVVVFLVILAFIISVIETNEKSKYYNTISYNEVNEIMDSEETKILYWASPDCSYCNMFTPVVKEVSYEYELMFNYLNTNNLNNEEYATMYTHFAAYDKTYSSKNLGTPSLILVKNGEIIDISVGYLEKEELIDYLKTNGLIKD